MKSKIKILTEDCNFNFEEVFSEKEIYSKFKTCKYSVIRHSNIYGPYDKFDLKDIKVKRWVDLALRIEGTNKTYGVHAAGVVIASDLTLYLSFTIHFLLVFFKTILLPNLSSKIIFSILDMSSMWKFLFAIVELPNKFTLIIFLILLYILLILELLKQAIIIKITIDRYIIFFLDNIF